MLMVATGRSSSRRRWVRLVEGKSEDLRVKEKS